MEAASKVVSCPVVSRPQRAPWLLRCGGNPFKITVGRARDHQSRVKARVRARWTGRGFNIFIGQVDRSGGRKNCFPGPGKGLGGPWEKNFFRACDRNTQEKSRAGEIFKARRDRGGLQVSDRNGPGGEVGEAFC